MTTTTKPHPRATLIAAFDDPHSEPRTGFLLQGVGEAYREQLRADGWREEWLLTSRRQTKRSRVWFPPESTQ